ncbi:MAG: class I SAM-dependent methyltransferase [Gemmatimonadales bacterium]
MREFPDHFSRIAAAYSARRPGYPPGLFAWLSGLAPGRELAWDCGTGSGQAAVPLATHFTRVVATDASEAQLRHAVAHPRVEYRVAPADACGLADGGVDLVTVAQALHWFDLDRFYNEVRRVARPGGLLAAWTYGLFQTGEREIDRLLRGFHFDRMGPYWPPQRRWVDQAYRTLPFPFPELEAPVFHMELTWRAADAIGYLGTWSAVARCRAAEGRDPVGEIAERLAAAWGGEERRVRWPLAVRVGRPTE